MKSVAHKSGHKGVADCQAIDLAFLSGEVATARAGGNVHAPKRGDIKILRSTADARQTTDRDTARERERTRASESESKGIPHAIVK